MGDEKNNQEVPFDMSKETLKSIRRWVDKITELSVGIYGTERINPNEMIVIKQKMVQQLIVLASPLIRNDCEEIEEFFSKIKITIGDQKIGAGWKKNIPIYSKEVDYSFDECVKGIEKALGKYFIPSFSEGERYYG